MPDTGDAPGVRLWADPARRPHGDGMPAGYNQYSIT